MSSLCEFFRQPANGRGALLLDELHPAVLGLVVSAVAMQGALTALGVNEADIKPRAVWILTYGNVAISLAAKAFKAADSAVRPKLVQGALAWAKADTESATFKADYDRQRESAKPKPPQLKGTVDDELALQKAERRKNLDQMKKNLEKMSPEMRKSMEAVVRQSEEQSAKTESDPKMQAMMRQTIEMQRATEEKSYRERLAAFEQRFPADPNILIAAGCRSFWTRAATWTSARSCCPLTEGR